MSYRHVFEKMGDVSQLIKDMDRFFNDGNGGSDGGLPSNGNNNSASNVDNGGSLTTSSSPPIVIYILGITSRIFYYLFYIFDGRKQNPSKSKTYLTKVML